MKIKRLIFNISLMILAFCATASIVVYSKYYDYSKEANTPSDSTTTNTSTESEESKLLNNLVSTLMSADSLSGTVIINGSGNTNVEGQIYYDTTNSTSLYTKIGGKYKSNNINLTAGLINDDLYVNYSGVKFKINTTNAFNVVTELLGGVTDGDFSSMFNLDTLKKLMSDMKITDGSNGGKIITINLPNITSLTIETNKSGFPTVIRSGVVSVGAERITATILLSQKAKPMPSITTTGYTNFEVDQNTTRLITTFMNIINDGGISLSGSLEVNDSSVGIINCTIAKDLSTKVILTFNSINVEFYYIKNNFYLNALGNKLKLSFSDAIKYINSVFGTNASTSTPKITMVNSTTIDVLNNKIALSVKDDKLINISVAGGNYSVNLNAVPTTESISFDNSNYSSISVRSLATLSKNIINASKQNQMAIEFAGSIGGMNANANGYIQFTNDYTINQLCLIGDIKDNRFAIYFKDGYYYLNSGSALTKFSTSAVDEFISYFSSIYGTTEFDANELINTIEKLKLSAELKSENQIEFNTTYGKVKANIYNDSIKVSTTGLTIGNSKFTGNLKLILNSTYYKHYISEFNPEYYTDFSDITSTTSALVNALKQGKTMSGNIRLTLDKILFVNTDIVIMDIGITVKSIYKNGNLGFEINLTNLPTNSLITDLSNGKYSNHQSLIQIAGNSIRIRRAAIEKASGKTIIAVDKKINITELSTINLYDILGIKKSIVSKFNSGSTGNDVNFDAILDGIKTTDSGLSINLSKALKGTNFNRFNVSLITNGSKLSSAHLNAQISKVLGIKLTLE